MVIATIISKNQPVPVTVAPGALKRATAGLDVIAACVQCATVAERQAVAVNAARMGMVGRTGERDTREAVA